MAEPAVNKDGAEATRSRLKTWCLGGILVLAVLFRLSDLEARNLWTDEAWVALAALAPSPTEALTLGRSTPPFYTLALWVLAHLFGGGELVLRSLSCAFGLGTVLLFRPLARRLVSPGAALLGLALVAVSPVLVYFSKELKQYSGDAFFAVLLAWLAEGLRERPEGSRWLALALAGLAALGFSHGAVFVLPVVLGILWLELPRARRFRVALLSAFWGLAFVAFYVLFFRSQVDLGLVAYWSQDFPDFSGPLLFLLWLGGALGRYCHYFFFSDWGWTWGVPLVAVGLILLTRQGPRRLLLYLVGPLLLTLGAAALHRYPFMGRYNGSRLLLFSAPFLYLTCAVGMAHVFTWLWRRPRRWLALILAAFILFTGQPLALIKENLRPMANRQELQPLAAYVQAHLRPGDCLYVYYHAISPFKYYYRGNLAGVRWGQTCVEAGLALPASGPEAPRRLWLVAAHFGDLDFLKIFAARLLGPGWRQEAVLTRRDAALLLLVPSDQALAKSPQAPPGSPQSGTAAPTPEKACGETPPPPSP